MAHLSSFLRDRPLDEFPAGTDIAAFLQFLIVIVQNQSLTVSIPVLHSWTKLLLSQVGDSEYFSAVIGPLLEICSQRLIPYESLPQDSNDPVIIFLSEDIDTVPVGLDMYTSCGTVSVSISFAGLEAAPPLLHAA